MSGPPASTRQRFGARRPGPGPSRLPGPAWGHPAAPLPRTSSARRGRRKGAGPGAALLHLWGSPAGVCPRGRSLSLSLAGENLSGRGARVRVKRGTCPSHVSSEARARPRGGIRVRVTRSSRWPAGGGCWIRPRLDAVFVACMYWPALYHGSRMYCQYVLPPEHAPAPPGSPLLSARRPGRGRARLAGPSDASRRGRVTRPKCLAVATLAGPDPCQGSAGAPEGTVYTQRGLLESDGLCERRRRQGRSASQVQRHDGCGLPIAVQLAFPCIPALASSPARQQGRSTMLGLLEG